MIPSLAEVDYKHFRLNYKWGFDGSSCHTPYKQSFCAADASDANVLITSIVPLKLTARVKQDGKTLDPPPLGSAGL